MYFLLTTVKKTSTFLIEYVFSIILHGSRSGTRARSKHESTHTRWDRARGAFVAQNIYTKKYLSFKPRGLGQAAKDDAKSAAIRWAAAENVDDGEASCGDASSVFPEGSPSMQPEEPQL